MVILNKGNEQEIQEHLKKELTGTKGIAGLNLRNPFFRITPRSPSPEYQYASDIVSKNKSFGWL